MDGCERGRGEKSAISVGTRVSWFRSLGELAPRKEKKKIEREGESKRASVGVVQGAVAPRHLMGIRGLYSTWNF